MYIFCNWIRFAVHFQAYEHYSWTGHYWWSWHYSRAWQHQRYRPLLNKRSTEILISSLMILTTLYSVIYFIYAGHLISCISWVRLSTNLRTQRNALLILHITWNPRIQVFTNMSNVVNINYRRNVQKNVVNNVDKSSLRAPWQNGPYKNT